MRPSKKTEVKVGEIYRDDNATRIERFVKVVRFLGEYGYDPLDAQVRSCDLRGEYCPKTPFTIISISRLEREFTLVAAPSTVSSENHD